MNDSAQNNLNLLRTRLKTRRAEQNPVDCNRGALLIRGRLFTWLATTRTRLKQEGKPLPQTIAAFWAMDQEPGLEPLMAQWVEEHDLTVSLPVIRQTNAPLEFRVWTPDTPMKKGAFGILEPDSPTAPLPDVVLVPTLGFTRQGDRIGYGKGYYDRTLAQLKAQNHPHTTIGIAWACGDLSGETYAPTAHDVPLDAILTDKGWAVKPPAA